MASRNAMIEAAAELSALDFTDETARLAKLSAEQAKIGEAEDKARKRIAELDKLIREFREPAGQEVAEALLEGCEATSAAQSGRSLLTLQDERARLYPALKALRHTGEDLLAETAEVRSAITGKLTVAVKPLVDLIMEDARAALQDLASCYASLSAIVAIGANVGNGRDLISKAIVAAGELADRDGTYTVPAETIDALTQLEGNPGLRGARVPRSVPAPQPQMHSSLLGAMAAAAAVAVRARQ